VGAVKASPYFLSTQPLTVFDVIHAGNKTIDKRTTIAEFVLVRIPENRVKIIGKLS
jgi:hypothetical protein